MKPGFLAPAGTLDNKPAHGDPCNRCGLCCIATLCPLAQSVFARSAYPGPCPAIEKDETGLPTCGLVAHPMRYAPKVALAHGVKRASDAALLLIGSSTGCDARFNGEPINPGFWAALREWDRKMREQIAKARSVWRVR